MQRQDHWSCIASSQINRPFHIPQKYKAFTCRSFGLPVANQLPNIKSAVLTLSRYFLFSNFDIHILISYSLILIML